MIRITMIQEFLKEFLPLLDGGIVGMSLTTEEVGNDFSWSEIINGQA